MRALLPIDSASLTIAVVADDDLRADRLAHTLELAGYPRLLRLPSSLFWCRLPRGGPVQVVTSLTPEALAASLDGFDGMTPCPLTLVGSPPRPDVLARMLALGLAGWWPESTLSPAPLAAALVNDAWQWRLRQEAGLKARQREAEAADQRWVEEALQVLMRRRSGMPVARDEACRRLRGAARQHGRPLGDFSRTLVEAARWAEAVNRAGQLRMLSQRLVRLVAQQAGPGSPGAWREVSLRERHRVAANLDLLRHLVQDLETGELRGAPGRRPPVPALQRDWRLLESFVCGPLARDRDLEEFDGAAERFLATAEAAVAAIRATAVCPGLELVDRCGRQRMAVQRIAKDGVLGVLLGQAWRLAALPSAMEAVDAEFAALCRSVQASDAVRAQLVAVRARWGVLRRAHRRPGAGSAAALADGADALLPLLERLADTSEACPLDGLR